MGLSGSDRGQAIQVGAILIFGIIILFLALYQATAVPAQNERIEFDSYLEATGDMEGLGNDIRSAASRDATTGTAVRTGAAYPARVLFVNPGPPANRIRATDAGNITVSNAGAVDSEADNTQVVWNGSARTYETKPIRFDSEYNELRVPDIVYESGTLYRPANESATPPYAPGETVLLSGQSLIEGDRITLISVVGDLDAGGSQANLVARPVSAHSRTVVVENRTGNVTLTVPSDLSATTWETELLDTEPNVLRVDQNGSRVDIVLRPGSYQLRLAKVEVRRQSDSNIVPNTEPEYVVEVAGDEASIAESQRVRLTAEVRDRFNNPKSGQELTFTTANGTFAASGSSTLETTTNDEGRASALFEPDDIGTLTVRAGRDPNGNGDVTDDGPLNYTTFEVYVSQNTSQLYNLEWDTAAIEGEQGIESCSATTCTYDLGDDPNDKVVLTANTTPAIEGVSVDFATNNSTVVSNLNPSEGQTDSTGKATTEAAIDTTGTAKLYASSTESSDTLTLEVIDSSTGGGGSPIQYVAGSGQADGPGGSTTGVRFELENTGTNEVDITAITVDSTSTSASQVREDDGGDGQYNREAFFNVRGSANSLDNPEDGYAESGTGVGIATTEPLDDLAQIPAGDTSDTYLYEFRESDGTAVDMTGATVNVTVDYDVDGGGSGSYSFSLTAS